MEKTRKRYSAEFKLKVALEALKEVETLSQLASKFSIHQAQISDWKKQLQTDALSIFQSKKEGNSRQQDQELSLLYQQIGQMKVELDWLKKKVK